MANSFTGQTVTTTAWVAAAVGGVDVQGQIVGILPRDGDIMIAIASATPSEARSLQTQAVDTENTYPVKSSEKLYMKADSGKSASVVVTQNV